MINRIGPRTDLEQTPVGHHTPDVSQQIWQDRDAHVAAFSVPHTSHAGCEFFWQMEPCDMA